MTRPHQIRRHARRMRRYGMQPVVIINDANQVPDLIIFVIGRWFWRYRSELAPFSLTLATIVVAGVLHLSHPGAWPLLAALTVLTSGAVLALGERFHLRRSERLYAALVAVTTGTWATAATAYGPFHGVLPRVLLAVPVLSIPWWAHRRRRARVAIERKLSAWPDIAKAIGLGSRVRSVIVDAWGWTARIALHRGNTVTNAIAKIPELESALGTRPGAIRIEPDVKHANQLLLRVLDADPHANPIGWKAPDLDSITQPIPLGIFEDATSVAVLLQGRHALIGGRTGAGKSGVLNVIIAALAACHDVVIWGIDLKGGMELRPWTPILGRLATTPEQAVALLSDAVAELNHRADKSGHDGTRVWMPKRQQPALLIIIDEYAELPEEATALTDTIARLGRAIAVTLLVATQRPTQQVMGHGATRSQMDVRISLRVRERRDVDLILGQGMYNEGWHAHTLDAPGKFLISAPEHSHPKRARAYLITDKDVATVACHHAVHRPVLNPPKQNQDMRASENVAQNHPRPVLNASPGEATSPEQRLWCALLAASEKGISVDELIEQTGKSRRWIYYRLQEHAKEGRAVQPTRGQWRANSDGT